ncbi:MAG: DUF1015 family protein, partial [Acidobacteria bacterium]|nr:DUF1015 family protein [Acidobacteriota bacterium]
MAIIKPFCALRPQPEQAAQVASVPYDVVNTAEARALAADNPLSFLRVGRPDLELPDESDHYADEVYELAVTNFNRLIKAAPLVQESEPCLYLYRLQMGEHEQTGVVACCSVDEYDQDVIRKHERTRRDKEDDRTRHILSLRAQTGPVFLTYRANTVIDELTRALISSAPLFDFIAPDGIAHTIWRIPARLNSAFEEIFREVPLLYIADGHHRAKSASRAREVLRAANAGHNGDEEYNYFQAVIFPDNQLRILPYHRVVRDLADHDQLEFFRRIGENVGPTSDAIRRHDWNALGASVHQSWLLNQELDSGTNPPAVAAIMAQIQDYLLGGKLLGAGGGGFLFMLAKDAD